MKRIVLLTSVIVMLLLNVKLVAQEVINVEPGYGTLNDAVKTNGGNKIYQLKAGGWYGLNAILETPAEPIQIIGEMPASSDQMYAMIQVGTNSDGATFSYLMTIFGDITLKRVYLVSADLNNSVSTWTLYQKDNARIIMDSIVVDPCGWQSFLAVNAEKKETYITNSLLMRHGNTISPWDGWLFSSQGTWDTNWDTLYVENNTIVNVGLFLYMADNFTQGVNDFVWFNHNTIMYAKAELKYSYITNSDFFTNNLLWQGGFGPFINNWNDSRVDGATHELTSLHCADTLNNETLPSTRQAFVEYNFNSVDPRINDDIKAAAANNQVAYLRPFVMPAYMADSSRESQMFNDDINFPYFKAGNNIEYYPNSDPYIFDGSFIDPGFTDPTIYAYTDSVVAWNHSAWKMEMGLPSDQYPPAAQWTNLLFTKDPVNTDYGNPTAWPRFDGVYTNTQLLNASIEKLPLGDLNWFPEAKAKWAANKSTIMQHITGLNESQLSLTSVTGQNGQVPAEFNLAQNYPNPFNPSTEIRYSIPNSGIVTLKVYNIIGQEVALLVNQDQPAGNYTVTFNASALSSGVYFYKLQSGSFSLTKKMEVIK
jgi:hypothetical protein